MAKSQSDKNTDDDEDDGDDHGDHDDDDEWPYNNNTAEKCLGSRI